MGGGADGPGNPADEEVEELSQMFLKDKTVSNDAKELVRNEIARILRLHAPKRQRL